MSDHSSFPKSGIVNQVCKEWLVREDGALAYRLQNEEFSHHLSGNKHRNALVREDFPKALSEQIREQQEAERARILYVQKIIEQEEKDAKIAAQLAERIRREEEKKHRLIESKDKYLAALIQDRDVTRYDEPSTSQQAYKSKPGQGFTRWQGEPTPLPGESIRPQHIGAHAVLMPPRHAYENVPLTQERRSKIRAEHGDTGPYENVPLNSNRNSMYQDDSAAAGNSRRIPELKLEYASQSASYTPQTSNYEESNACAIVPDNNLNVITNTINQISINRDGNVTIDHVKQRRLQEQEDAELALKIQQQEEIELSQERRDELLAIEAQDKELARLLQEREKNKARKAREKAKQKALAKKQLVKDQAQKNQMDVKVPLDDSYSNPKDFLDVSSENGECSSYLTPKKNYHHTKISCPPTPEEDEDVNYSYPIDHMNGNVMPESPGKYPLLVRPSILELTHDTEFTNQPLNIATIIDPTYPRRVLNVSHDSGYMASSSPFGGTPEKDIAPPYMPIQGQRRTSSLEKKRKSRAIDGCKQQ